jgi:mRNA interferase RelE/StbE
MKAIAFTGAAARQWAKLPAAVRDRLRRRLHALAQGQPTRLKRLSGSRALRLRVGDYRVVFDENGNTITVVAVGHRREVYR